MVHVLHFGFHSSSSGCLRSTTLLLTLWGPVDCNFGDGVGILTQHVPNPVPLLSGYGGDNSRPEDVLIFVSLVQ